MLPRLGGPALPRLLPPLLLLLLGAGVSAEVLFRCPPCTAGRVAACETTPAGAGTPCAELVREPGCGCCSVCARLEGEACGVYTPRCAQGLRCYPHPDSELPLQALVQGAGTCEKRRDADYGASSEQVAGNAGPGQLFGRNLEGSGAGGGARLAGLLQARRVRQAPRNRLERSHLTKSGWTVGRGTRKSGPGGDLEFERAEEAGY